MKLKFWNVYCAVSMAFTCSSFATSITDNGALKNSTEYRYFSNMHYIGLHAENLKTAQKLAPQCPQCLVIQGNIEDDEGKIEALSEVLLKIPNISSLCLEENKLTKCPLKVGCLKNLGTLNLSKNQLTALPIEISCLTNLRNLHLEDNRFEIFLDVVCKLRNLKILYIEKNQLTVVPLMLWTIDGLKEVTMDGYLVSQVPRYSVANKISNACVKNYLLARKNNLRWSNQQIDWVMNNYKDFVIKKITMDEANKYEWTNSDGWRMTQQPADSVAVRVSLKKVNSSSSMLNTVAQNTGANWLHIYTKQNNLKAVKWLVNHGAKIDFPDKSGRTPLMIAAEKGHPEIVEYFVEKGADVNVSDDTGWTPLMSAAITDHLNIVKYLIEQGKANIDAQDERKQTALMISVMYKHPEIAEYLVRNGANINEKTLSGLTSLTRAVDSESLDMVKFLIERGADITTISNEGETLLHFAAKNSHTDIAEYLINKGFDINAEKNDKSTPLYFAILKGNLNMVKFLVGHGADINHSTKERITPLLLSVMERYLPITEYLLEHGANPNTTITRGTTDGWTPLIFATTNGDSEMVKILIAYGADVNAKAGEFSVMDTAQIRGDTIIIKLLENHIKKERHAKKKKHTEKKQRTRERNYAEEEQLFIPRQTRNNSFAPFREFHAF